ncbi:MAG: tyrosine-type recombinase/integrase [Halococcoides sp.]
MSDYPEQAIESMRRQCEMVLEFGDALVGELVECDTAADIHAVDGLSEADAKTLAAANGHIDLNTLFGVADRDARVLLDMSDEIRLLGEAEYSEQRHEFLLRRCFTLAKEVGGLADALADRGAAEDIVRHINSEKAGSPETNKDYRTAFRMFGGLVSDGPSDEKPESIDWVPGGYPSNYDPAPDPAKMFRWGEHIQPMLKACNNSRDRALIALAWDLGPRPGELYDLTVGRFVDHKYGLQVTLERGKKGTRSPVLIPSTPYVQQWLEDHPTPDDPGAALWTRTTRPDSITNQRIRHIIKAVADRADMTPPSTPTPSRMRKSSASFLASQGVSQAHLEDHHGWNRGSGVAARYIAVFGDANDREIARAHGRDVEREESEPLAPVACPRCGQETPRERDFCMHCDQVLDPEQMDLVDEVLDLLDEQLIQLDDPETRRKALSARRTVEDKPNVLDTDELHEFVSSLD